MANSSDDDEYFLPLQDQRVFGAGIKRKRVQFVPSSSGATATADSTQPNEAKKNAGDHYLSIVLKRQPPTKEKIADAASEPTTEIVQPAAILCEICNLALTTPPPDATTSEAKITTAPHEASVAHQVCLAHSYPPSHLDRRRAGLKYLSSYGWDPDSRLGLGADGEGIRAPIKAKEKRDTAGLGVVVKKNAGMKERVVKRLGAKEVRKGVEDERKKGDRLREMFYRDENVEKYLGSGG